MHCMGRFSTQARNPVQHGAGLGTQKTSQLYPTFPSALYEIQGSFLDPRIKIGDPHFFFTSKCIISFDLAVLGAVFFSLPSAQKNRAISRQI